MFSARTAPALQGVLVADEQDAPPLAPPAKEFPVASLVGLQVPSDFNAVIIAAAAKNKTVYEDQLLAWAMKGAECERRSHESKLAEAGRI